MKGIKAIRFKKYGHEYLLPCVRGGPWRIFKTLWLLYFSAVFFYMQHVYINDSHMSTLSPPIPLQRNRAASEIGGSAARTLYTSRRDLCSWKICHIQLWSLLAYISAYSVCSYILLADYTQPHYINCRSFSYLFFPRIRIINKLLGHFTTLIRYGGGLTYLHRPF